MGPTADLDDSPLPLEVDAVVAAKGVVLQVAAILFEERGRPVPRMVGGHQFQIGRVFSVVE